jgi:hypothetical protein
MELNKALGLDGFPVEYYKQFWEVIKNDHLKLFAQLWHGDLPLFKLNFGVITSLPKKEDAFQIQQYRPICLLNVSFNIFTKAGTNRIIGIAHKVIVAIQYSFMPGRHILKGVVFLHETNNELHRKKMDGVPFKIDFEKAYDKVKWPFLQQSSLMKCFSPKWCELVANFVQGGSVEIRVNENIGHYFQTRKGLDKVILCPLSCLTLWPICWQSYCKSKRGQPRRWSRPTFIWGGSIHSTICLWGGSIHSTICRWYDPFHGTRLAKAVNMKPILCIFEQLSRIKYIFTRVKFSVFECLRIKNSISKYLVAKLVSLPFWYLGNPIHYIRFLNKEYNSVENRFEWKLGCWQSKLLSCGDSLVLINFVLTSLLMSMLSFLEILKGYGKD